VGDSTCREQRCGGKIPVGSRAVGEWYLQRTVAQENGTWRQYRGRALMLVGNSAVGNGTCRCEHSRDWRLEGAMVQENGTSRLWWSGEMVSALRNCAVGWELLERAAQGRLFPSHGCCRGRQGGQCCWDMMSWEVTAAREVPGVVYRILRAWCRRRGVSRYLQWSDRGGKAACTGNTASFPG